MTKKKTPRNDGLSCLGKNLRNSIRVGTPEIVYHNTTEYDRVALWTRVVVCRHGSISMSSTVVSRGRTERGNGGQRRWLDAIVFSGDRTDGSVVRTATVFAYRARETFEPSTRAPSPPMPPRWSRGGYAGWFVPFDLSWILGAAKYLCWFYNDATFTFLLLRRNSFSYGWR